MKNICTNKKARFEYEVIKEYTAGIQLMGNEVKSIRNGEVSLVDAYCSIRDGEIFIRNMRIPPYMGGKDLIGYEPSRIRKLLLNKAEINQLHSKVKERGFTIIPLSVVITDEGFVKLRVGLCRGKTSYDKKAVIKNRDLEKQTKKELTDRV